MKRINAAIEAADENLDVQALRAQAAEEYGVRIVLTPEYADMVALVCPEPIRMGAQGEEFLPPVRIESLRAALARFGVRLATPASLCDALTTGPHAEEMSAKKALRAMFREFKSNPLSKVSLRGKDPVDRSKLERKLRAKRFKEDFYNSLAEFIADHPSIPYKDYWDADRRPYEKQWPEYRAAVKEAKIIRANREERKRRAETAE